MTFGRFQRSSRVIAAVLLLAAARLPHLAGDDLECLPATLATYGEHDESQHALQPDTADGADHCAVCHWTRSLRSPRVPPTVVAVDSSRPRIIPIGAEGVASAAVIENLPARAPPTVLS